MDQNGKDFKNLVEAHRSYIREGETNAVMTITSSIKNLKTKDK